MTEQDRRSLKTTVQLIDQLRKANPKLLDLRETPKQRLLTAANIAARVDSLLTEVMLLQDNPGLNGLGTETNGEIVEELDHSYSAVTRTITMHGIPIASRTDYQLQGTGEFSAKERGVFRPAYTMRLLGRMSTLAIDPEDFSVAVTKYIGPEDETIDVFQTVLGIQSVASTTVGTTYLQEAYEQEIARICGVNTSL